MFGGTTPTTRRGEEAMKTAIRRLITGLLLATTLFAFAPVRAEAGPLYWYGSSYTYAHGWVVKAGNDSYSHIIRTKCHWYASGSRWSTNWLIYPGRSKWTTSDYGTWGNHAPTGLSCSYTIVG
jgi:hypothetical protein